jgi:NAD-dependent SIR2 family protein deacetylase
MSVLDKIYSDNLSVGPPPLAPVNWCEKDFHNLYEYFADFNEWLDGDEGLDIRIRYQITDLANPSKALFAGDLRAYKQEFQVFRIERRNQVLGEDYINATFNDSHWFDRNTERFEQLIEALKEGAVVPFIGAGISVECGFPTWKGHLLQQGRTSGLDPDHVAKLLDAGAYEAVIEEIEARDFHDAFIQEIKDVFSKTGAITQTTLRLTELFTDTIITTNYDHVIEQAFDTGEGDEIQLLETSNILDPLDASKTTVIKLHGDIRHPANCIISKNQYDLAYGNGHLDLSNAIPKVLSFHYRTSNLLFLGL